MSQRLTERFDIALITIGVLNWMPDIALLMDHVASTLELVGSLVVYETHPFLEVFDPPAANPLLPASSYFQREPFVLQDAIVYEGETERATAPSQLVEYPHFNREEL